MTEERRRELCAKLLDGGYGQWVSKRDRQDLGGIKIMTDEERQEIVRNLRNYHPSRVGNWTFTRAADELERLAGEVKELKDLMLGMEVPDK